MQSDTKHVFIKKKKTQLKLNSIKYIK